MSHVPRPVPVRAPAPVRLTRRGVFAGWVVVLVTVGIIVFGLLQGSSPAVPAASETTRVTLLPGESLWTVAQQVNPRVDPRVTVDAIRDLNGLGSASIVQSGSELTVPVFAAGR
jgi:Tfp pilus assembly protein FimV